MLHRMAESVGLWCGVLWQEYSKTLAAALYASLKEVRLSPTFLHPCTGLHRATYPLLPFPIVYPSRISH